jgi:hypothetical protein
MQSRLGVPRAFRTASRLGSFMPSNQLVRRCDCSLDLGAHLASLRDAALTNRERLARSATVNERVLRAERSASSAASTTVVIATTIRQRRLTTGATASGSSPRPATGHGEPNRESRASVRVHHLGSRRSLGIKRRNSAVFQRNFRAGDSPGFTISRNHSCPAS